MICSISSSSKAAIIYELLALLALMAPLNCARMDSGRAPSITALAPLRIGDLIGVLPVANLTGKSAPLEPVGQLLRASLAEKGFRLLDDDVLAKFMKRHRVRDVSGVSSRVSSAMKEETGAGAILITSLEVFQENKPPRISLFSRLVTSGDQPEIVWMEGVGLSGESAPGLLDLGRVEDPAILLERAVRCLSDSLERSLSETDTLARAILQNEFNTCDPQGNVVSASQDERGKKRYRPQSFFRSAMLDVDRRYRVAVIPFLNQSERRNAGNIVALHFVDQLIRNEFLTVIEPGLVREQLLKHRIVMQAGPSRENAKALTSEEALGADLVFSGTVFDYQDAIGVPEVDFSLKIIESERQSVAWSSRSHNTGGEGVFFFNQGRIHTTHRLASEMARGTFEVLKQ